MPVITRHPAHPCCYVVEHVGKILRSYTLTMDVCSFLFFGAIPKFSQLSFLVLDLKPNGYASTEIRTCRAIYRLKFRSWLEKVPGSSRFALERKEHVSTETGFMSSFFLVVVAPPLRSSTATRHKPPPFVEGSRAPRGRFAPPAGL